MADDDKKPESKGCRNGCGIAFLLALAFTVYWLYVFLNALSSDTAYI
jgi:hypothetical protein